MSRPNTSKRRPQAQPQGPRNYRDPFVRKFSKFASSISAVTIAASAPNKTAKVLSHALNEVCR